ncbi:MAG TPA: argininosuccinate lyase [Bryobacteraceae bacterium]|nr:argininosuccinate lyase [Bryobacteraceae bacterium]HPU72538.1 argininosuccinate lyase [Bryobacteraceae bacterium]
MKLWGGRFEQGPSEIFERFSGSLAFDRRLIEADIRGSQAFARALERVGILSAEERARLVEAFDEIAAEAKRPEFFEGAEDEDVHTLVIRKLRERTGALADKIHTGRSRNEQVSLDTRLWLREEIDRATERLLALMESLLELARRYPDAVIPGYTHLRRAQAVLWPHYLLAYFEMFSRDWERLRQARARVNVMPLGSGALAGSGFPFDREALARDLGFDGLTRNSMDVSADRDFVLDFLYAASLIMVHLSRLAEDWILYSSEEFGWLELSDQVTSGSSLMPQKKNPDSLELIRGKSGRVFGCLNSLFMTMKGLPLTYNRDMQEDKEPLFEAADQLSGALEMARAVADSVRLNPEVPAAAAEESWVVATDLAEALARAGTPFHRAHQIVGRLVLESVRQKKRPADWSAEELTAFAPEFTPEMARLLDPREGMKSREIAGGTGPGAVAAALAEAAQRLNEMRAAR